MYFNFKLKKLNAKKPIVCTVNTKINVSECETKDYLRRAASGLLLPTDGKRECGSISFVLGMPESLRKRIKRECALSDSEEQYAIVISNDITVYSPSARGLCFGLATLIQLCEEDELCEGLIYDYPVCEFRCYKLYLPAYENVGLFKDIIDLLAYLRYNYVMIEIGGAMEYKRHPEINTTWVEYSKDIKRYSGRATEIQTKTYGWKKNSIHCDNGEGRFLSQDVCRELADYCTSRGIEVIPECPTLSHCDYLVMAHPEISERPDDKHPDTYCPLNPESYKIVFDILDEVIDVFRPKRINIGHDEAYSIGICEKCRKHSPARLYADDVIKIKNYLDQKGVGTIMWAEKLLRAFDRNGKPFGGSGRTREQNGGFEPIPALYPCRDMLPDGITYINWYWSFGENYDKIYHKRGFDMVYGNLTVLGFENWEKRVSWGSKGGVISNWGSLHPEYMQRNRQYLNLVSGAYAFWCDDFGKRPLKDELFDALKETHRLFLKGRKTKDIKIVHTTDMYLRYKSFYDGTFIVDETFLIGNYEVGYSDGTTALLPVKYGTNISSIAMEDYLYSNTLREASYSTLPTMIGDKLYYETVYTDPFPEKDVVSVTYKPLPTREDVRVILKSFCVCEAQHSEVENESKKVVVDADESYE